MAKYLSAGLLLAILSFASISFADVGPSPPSPEVIIHLTTNNAPETSITRLTYNCMGGTDPSDNGAVSARVSEFDCVGGTCTKAGWYYKLNPCYQFPSGQFTYMYGGIEIRTETFNNTEKHGKYEITIDAPSGRITKKDVSDPIEYTCCTSVAMIPLLLLGITLHGSKK